MARAFVAASLQALTLSTAPAADEPFSMSCWFNQNSLVNDSYIYMSIGNAAGSYYHSLGTQGTGQSNPGKLSAYSYSGAAAGMAVSTGNAPIGVWASAVGVFGAANSRAVYLNGTDSGTNSSNTNVGQTGFKIGVTGDSTPFGYMSGNLAECAIWNIALTSTDALMLAAGISPLLIKPQNLIGYWPLYGKANPEIDIIGGYDLTLVNSPTAAGHCRVLYPSTIPHTLKATLAAPVAQLYKRRFIIAMPG